MDIEKAIANAAASMEIEGLHVDEQSKEWCRKVLRGEMTFEQYMELAKEKAGIKSTDEN